MNSVAALTLTFVQLITVLAAIGYNNVDLLGTMVIYGSPIYVLTHLSQINPYMSGTQLANFLLMSFHTFKYFFLIRSFIVEASSMYRNGALVLEVLYLGICIHYMNMG